MGRLSRKAFLGKVATFLAQRYPRVQLERDLESFALHVDGRVLSLENVYRMLAHDSDEFEARISSLLDELLQAPTRGPDGSATLEEMRDRVLPLVLSAGPRDVGGLPMATQQLLDGLVVAYGIDSDRSIAYLPQNVLENWGIDIDELHAVALDNLVRRSETLAAHAAQDEHGQVNLILIQELDGFDASRILLPGLHGRLRQHLGSPFVAGIPNRDLLVCFRDTPEMVDRLRRQILQDYNAMPHQVSDRLFLVTADGIAPY